VLFYSDRGGNYNVWSIDPDGSGLRQLTKGGWRGYPVPSPDGSRIVTDDIETHRLFIYDTQDFGKPPEELPPNPDATVANLLCTDWSPDGQRILYASPSTPGGGVWMYTRSDRTHRRATDGSGGAWLKNGRQFVYANRGLLHIFDVTSNTSREILAIPGESLAGGRLALNDSRLFFSVRWSTGISGSCVSEN
jgi:Tol biopolymer transport system component